MDTWLNKALRCAAWVFITVFITAASAFAQTANTCLDCHSVLDPPLQVTAEQFSHDVHSQKGLTCASCHGGDPTKPDESAMSKAAGFRGKIDRSRVPTLCGSCHSDSNFMRKYNPSLRTDQLSQYKTSVHGKLFAKGDTKVAVCTDCHGVHDLRSPQDAASKVHPLNVAKTCSRCHADPDYMKSYGIPTDQFSKYSSSVHHEALAVRGDLSAPTCTTCHGNHGATPPGTATVQNVCANCHVFQAQLYDQSPHGPAFAAAQLPGCVTCHANHGIQHPTDERIGTSAQAVCTECHTEGNAGFQAASTMRTGLNQLATAIAKSDAVLSRAESYGMEVSDARLEQDQARDALTKARVSVHGFKAETVDQEIQAGVKITGKTLKAGQDALAEREYRRRGLGISLIFIFATVLGLFLYIRKIERSAS